MTANSRPFRFFKGKPNICRYLGFLAGAAAVGLSTPAWAVDYTWTGNSNNTWSTAGNWGGTTPVNAASSAVFFGAPVSNRVAPNLTTSPTVGSIIFNSGASAFTFTRGSSNILTLSAGGSVTNNSTNLQTFTTPVVLGGASTWNTASGAMAVGGVLSGAGGTLVKTGTGVLTLTATNTYGGGTTISAGTLQVGNTGRLGTGGVTNDGVLQYNNSTGTVIEANVISGTGRLNQVGTGTLSLTGTNSYQGGTSISAGSLQFSSVSNFGSGPVALNGGALRWATGNTADISGLITIGASGGSLDTNGNSVTLASALAGNGTLTKAGTGTLFLASTYSYAGNTAITGGTLDFAAGTLGSGTALIVNGGELRWGTGNTEGLAGKTISIGTGTGTLNTNGNDVTLAAVLSGAGNLVKTGDGTLTLNAAGSSTGTSAIVNGGVLRLGNASALSTVRSLVVNSTTANGSATFDLNGNNLTITTLTLGGATARANTTNTVTTGAGTLFLGGDVTYTRASARADDPSTAYINGNLDLGSGVRTFTVADSSLTKSDLTINANITSGSSTGLTKAGAGVLVLAGTNTYSGSTTINAGAIRISSAENLPATSNVRLNGGVLELAGDVALTYGTGAGQVQWTAGGGFSAYGGDRTVNYNGGAAVTWGMDFARTGTTFILSSVNSDSKTIFANDINLGGVTRTVSTNNGSAAIDAELSGVISNGNLSIVGNGTIVLSGPASYTGVVSVDGGNLDLGSSLGSNAPASSLVLNGGTLISSGTGGTTNRLFQVTANGGYVESSGSGAIEFANSGSILYGTANQVRTITLDGTNTGNNIFRSSIGNNGSGAVRVDKEGSGSWTLSGSNSYTGLTYIYEGTLSIASDYALGNTSGVTLLSNTTLNLNNVNTGSKLFSLAGAGASGTGALTFAGTSTISGTMRIDGTSLVIGGDGTLNLNAYMSEMYSYSVVTKVGSGTIAIHNPGIPDGLDWIINEGLVILDTANFTSMSGTIATVNNGGTLRIAGSTNNQINDYTGLLVNSGGVVDLNGRYESVIALKGAGTVTNTAAGTAARLNLGVSDWFQDATFSGSLQDGAGTLALLKTGTNAGAFTLTGSNTYSGGTTLTSGTLVAGNNAAFGTGVIALNGGVLTGDAARTLGNALRLTNNSAIGGTSNLTFTNVLTNFGGNRILTVSNTGTTTLGGVNLSNDNTGRTLTINTTDGLVIVNGVIANGGNGAGQLTKQGAGTLILSGNSTYTGATVVSGGGLVVNGDNSAATGAVFVEDTAVFSGTGTIGGDTTIRDGGTLSPGNSPGTITFASDLTLEGGSIALFEAGDLVDVNGLLTLGDGWTLTVTSGFQNGGSTTLFTYDTFGGLGLQPTIDYSGLGFTPTGPLTITDTGSAIVLNGISIVPEPATLALLMGAGAVLMGVRRRRATAEI